MVEHINLKDRTYIEKINASMENKEIVLAGWAQEIRDLNKIKFIVIRDKTDSIQCVALPDESKNAFEKVSEVTKESSIAIKGIVKKSQQAKKGFEILIKEINILNKSLPLPIDISGKIATNIDKRLDYRFLDIRRPEINAIFKVRSEIYFATVEYFEKNGFIKINTPKITVLGVESGAELFEIEYFDKKAYLSQSPQVYKQMFVAAGFEKVYEIGPVFRAEKSHTTRHLTEFTGIDMEMGFINDENDVMDVVEEYMKYIIKRIKEKCKKELEILKVDINMPEKIPRLPMGECKKLLSEQGKNLPEDEDFDPESEKLVGKIVKEKYGCDFVFVTHYPWKKRPFYHMLHPSGKTTRSFDLLFNGVEIATGAQREHRYEILKKQAKEKGLDLDKMEDYSNLFKYGIPPHGGVGLGLDRITQRLLKLDNIREAILLPRDPERLRP